MAATLIRHDIDIAKSARTDCGAAEPTVARIGDGHSVSGIVGPDLGHAFGRFVYRGTHAGENLLFGHADHLGAGILCFLRALYGTATQQYRGAERHDSQDTHVTGSPRPMRIQAQPGRRPQEQSRSN
jgi:hypothetical protein